MILVDLQVLRNFVIDIYDGNVSIEDAKKEQDELESKIKNLNRLSENQKKGERKQEI